MCIDIRFLRTCQQLVRLQDCYCIASGIFVTTFATCPEDAKDVLWPRSAEPKPTTARDADTAAPALTYAAAAASPTGGQEGSGCGHGRDRSATRTKPVRGHQSRERGRGAKRNVADDPKVDSDIGRGQTMGQRRGRRRTELLHAV